jgi:hypothetical protein
MSNLIDRIRKLIAHERSARAIGSVAEAETFAAYIQKLLMEHKISMSEVDCTTRDAEDPIGALSTSLTTKSVEKWINALAFGVGSNFFCRVLGELHHSGKARVTFIGRESDRVAAIEMFKYLCRVADNLVKNYLQATVPSIEAIKKYCADLPCRNRSKIVASAQRKMRREARVGYLLGFAAAIQNRLAFESRSWEKSSVATTALIVRDREAIEQYIAREFHVRKNDAVMPPLHDREAVLAGFAAGNKIALSNRLALEVGN